MPINIISDKIRRLGWAGHMEDLSVDANIILNVF